METATPPRTASPLCGVTVLELGQFIAGPFAGQQLADLGAEVIKIERPGQGDPFRQFVVSSKMGGYAHNFQAFNRNKLGITLDLQQEPGREVFRRLAVNADVVLENFRPGVLDRLALDYAQLREINPRLIFCSISGFSNDGPYRDRAAFDTIGQALSGMLHLFVDPERPCVRGPTIADQATSLQAANAIIAALYSRERTGVGARIDISMLDAAIAFMPDTFTASAESDIEVGPQTRASFSQSFVFRCADDKMIGVHVGGPEQFWHALVAAVGDEAIAADPRFADRMSRVAHFSALTEAFAAVIKKQTHTVWLERMHLYDVPAAAVSTISEVFDDPEVRHSGIFDVVTHPVFGQITRMRRAARIDNQRDDARHLPPMLGEHTDDVLRRAGYADVDIAALRAEKII